MDNRDERRIEDHVRRALAYHPNMTTRLLHKVATEQFPDLAGMDVRSFSARYVRPAQRDLALLVRRRAGLRPAPGRPWSSRDDWTGWEARGREARGPDRDQLRRLLMEFAQEVAGAESPADLVGVLRRAETYIDRLAEAGR